MGVGNRERGKDMAQVFTHEALHQRITEVFTRAGMSPPQAAALARVFAAAERDEDKAHGLYRIAGSLRTLKAGKVNGKAQPRIIASEGAIIRIDADGGFNSAAFEMGLPMLAERARDLGMAALVINDCTHITALWPEIEAITDHGLAGLAMCPSYATVAPTGGRAPLLGTNPLAFGWPRPDGRPPYVFDFATSMVARGHIELERIAGRALPEGWAVDSDGNPTTDPETALAGAMLPFGAHKGSAISTMIELLAAAMIGDLTSAEALDYLGTTTLAPRHGELILALDPVKFAAGRPDDPFARAERLFAAIEGQGARLPSSRRYAARARTLAEGITLSDEDVAQIERFLAQGLDAVE